MTGFAELGARSNFSFLDGASHPAELVQAAAALGLAGLSICDTNSLAGVVRGHVAAQEAGLRFVVGCRLVLEDGSSWLTWPTDRAAYGRLTALLSRGRMHAPKGSVIWAARISSPPPKASCWRQSRLPSQRPASPPGCAPMPQRCGTVWPCPCCWRRPAPIRATTSGGWTCWRGLPRWPGRACWRWVTSATTIPTGGGWRMC
ncbi:PHP domain-containing protein [Siccirubricoccus deserti]